MKIFKSTMDASRSTKIHNGNICDCCITFHYHGTVFICLVLTIMTLPIDIVLSPFELLAIIISFFIERGK